MNKIGRTDVINIKVESQIKRDAMILAEELGFTLSSVMNAFLKQFIRIRSVNFSIKGEEAFTPYALEMLKRADDDVKRGRVKSFRNMDSMRSYLDKLISADKE